MSATPPDSAVQRFLFAYWEVWQGLAARAEVQLTRQHGLDLRAFMALSYVQGGVHSPGELSRELGVPRYVVTRTLDALTALRAVEREVDGRDARRQQLRVTAAGQQLWADAFRTVEQVCADPLDRLGPELTPLTAQLERLARATRPPSPVPPPSLSRPVPPQEPAHD